MSSTLLKQKPVYPIRLEEAKNFLRTSLNDTMEDWAIMEAVKAATSQAESMTNRFILNSNWDYVPEQKADFYELPFVPVTEIEIFDTSGIIELKVPERAYEFSASSVHPKGSPVRATVKVLPHELNIPPDALPLAPITPPGGLPDVPPIVEPEGDINSGKIRINMTCGFPIKELEGEEINPKSSPVIKSVDLIDDKVVCFTFDRPINEVICLDLSKPKFSVFDAAAGTDITYPIAEIKVEKGIVYITTEEMIVLDGVNPVIMKAIFYDTVIADKFMNILDISLDVSGTVIVWSMPVTPEPFKTEIIEELECPEAIKRWILVRVGTFYQQRTDIALRSGTANNSMFGRNFVDCLLDPYIVLRFV